MCFLTACDHADISNNLPPGDKPKKSHADGLHSDYPYHQGTAGHLDGNEPFTVQTIWFMSELDHENGANTISSGLLAACRCFGADFWPTF